MKDQLTTTEALGVALGWANKGMRVFPVAIGWDEKKVGTTKRPLTPHGHISASLDTEEITRMFNTSQPREGEVVGVGIWPGPSGIVVLDCDRHHEGFDGPGFADLEGFVSNVVVNTASGGEHRLFKKRDPGVKITNNIPRMWQKLIDVRSDLGWIVAPGTITPWGSWELQHEYSEPPVCPRDLWSQLEATAIESSIDTWRTYKPQLHDEKLHPLTIELFNLLVNEFGVQANLATFHSRPDRDPWLEATRPGKSGGTSMSIGYIRPDVVNVFSTGWDGVDPGKHSLSDILDAAHLQQSNDGNGSPFLDWDELYATDPSKVDWLIPGVFEQGKGYMVYSPAKTGKSLLALDWCASLASGINPIDRTPQEPIHVVYMDYENSKADIHQRLLALGYETPEPYRTHFHYWWRPGLFLDDKNEGKKAVEVALRTHAKLVIIDTATRTVIGDENSADTWKQWYNFVGAPLTANEVSWIRMDHTGKDENKGSRGSSNKVTDVDAVWKLKLNGPNQLTLTLEEHRQANLSERIKLFREEVDFVLRHTVIDGIDKRSVALQACIEAIDALGLPDDTGWKPIWNAMKAGRIAQPGPQALVKEAVGLRKARLLDPGAQPANDPPQPANPGAISLGGSNTSNPLGLRGQPDPNANNAIDLIKSAFDAIEIDDES